LHHIDKLAITDGLVNTIVSVGPSDASCVTVTSPYQMKRSEPPRTGLSPMQRLAFGSLLALLDGSETRLGHASVALPAKPHHADVNRQPSGLDLRRAHPPP
jgi:hypothetical protein